MAPGSAECKPGRAPGVQQPAPDLADPSRRRPRRRSAEYSEIKAAVDPSIISDPSLIPSYEEIRRFDDACNYAAEQAANKKKPFKLDTIRELYSILAPEEKAKGLPFRKENPLHRLYYHDIAAPEKILPAMRKLGEWIDEPATKTST